MIGGLVVDSATGSRLPCVEVIPEDSSGRLSARGLTAIDGVFQFPSPERGVYRLRFDIWGHRPVFGPLESLESSTEQSKRYVLSFGYPSDTTRLQDEANAPPRLKASGRGPQYPRELRSRAVQGSALMRFVVDTAGRVDPESIAVVSSTEPSFGASVRTFLRSARHTPARRDDRAVCALMVQPFYFTVER